MKFVTDYLIKDDENNLFNRQKITYRKDLNIGEELESFLSNKKYIMNDFYFGIFNFAKEIFSMIPNDLISYDRYDSYYISSRDNKFSFELKFREIMEKVNFESFKHACEDYQKFKLSNVFNSILNGNSTTTLIKSYDYYPYEKENSILKLAENEYEKLLTYLSEKVNETKNII